MKCVDFQKDVYLKKIKSSEVQEMYIYLYGNDVNVPTAIDWLLQSTPCKYRTLEKSKQLIDNDLETFKVKCLLWLLNQLNI